MIGKALALTLLAGALSTPGVFGPDYDAELKTLRAEYQKARAEYQKPLKDAKTPEERKAVKLDPEKDPAKTFVKKFADLGKRAKGTEAGLNATLDQLRAMQVIAGAGATSAGGPPPKATPEGEKVLEEAVTNYLQAPYLVPLVQVLGQMLPAEKANALREKIVAKSPHAPVRGEARYALASQLLQAAGKDEAKKSQALEMMRLVAKETPDSAVGKRAAGMIFEAENLAVGKAAPDFKAKDQWDKEFKLSDYRGKVVLLDFWGFW